MKLCYIKKLENEEEAIDIGTYKIPNRINKIIFKIKKFFNIIVYKPINDNLGIFYISKDNEKTIKKLIQKINSNNIKAVTISNNLSNYNYLYENSKITILDGNWLLNFLIEDVIDMISTKRTEEINTISILTEGLDEIIMNSIEMISKKAKNLNIVTNNSKKFENLQSNLYNKYGIMITVGNNKKKSLLKSDLIINFDFNKEKIKKYSIKKGATVISIYNKINSLKEIEVSTINNYDITLSKEYVLFFKQYNLYNSFNKKILYESLLFIKNNHCFHSIRNKIKIDKIKLWSIN